MSQMNGLEGATEKIVGILVYELIANAIFYALRDTLIRSLDIIFAGFGVGAWLILWLIADGVPPIVYATGDLFE